MNTPEFFILAAFIYLAPHTHRIVAQGWGVIFMVAAAYFSFASKG